MSSAPSSWDEIDVLQAALEAVSDYETPRHAREMAEDMLPIIHKAGWALIRIDRQLSTTPARVIGAGGDE